jgi:hypothetical protein
MYGLAGDGASNYRRSPVTTDWQKIEMPIQAQAGRRARIYLMSTGPGTVYFDEVTLVAVDTAAPTATAAAGLKPAR